MIKAGLGARTQWSQIYSERKKVGMAPGNPKPMQGDHCFGISFYIHMENMEVNSDSRERGWKDLDPGGSMVQWNKYPLLPCL